MSENQVLHLNAGNFEQEVLKSTQPVLVDFWASWCAPCRIVGPIVEQLAADYAGKVKIAKLNADEYPDIAQRFRIFSIPTLILFQEGRILNTIIGAQPKAQLSSFLETALQKKRDRVM